MLGLLWRDYGKIFGLRAVKFPEDLGLARVKNRSFGTPNFSIKGRYIYTYFFVSKNTSRCTA